MGKSGAIRCTIGICVLQDSFLNNPVFICSHLFCSSLVYVPVIKLFFPLKYRPLLSAKTPFSEYYKCSNTYQAIGYGIYFYNMLIKVPQWRNLQDTTFQVTKLSIINKGHSDILCLLR